MIRFLLALAIAVAAPLLDWALVGAEPWSPDSLLGALAMFCAWWFALVAFWPKPDRR